MKVSRREFIKAAGGFVCAGTLASQFPGLIQAAEKKRFNILFLITDQHNHSVLGCAGNPIVKTPNLDKLASQGARFTNACCATPFCSPTRASLLTGMWPHTHGITQNIAGKKTGLDDKTVATEQILFDKGYFTNQMGKWHLGDISSFRCYDKDSTGQLKDEYRDYLAALPKDKWPKLKPGEVKVGEVAMLPEMDEVRKKDTAGGKNPDEVSKIGRLLVPPEHTYESWLTDRCIGLLKKHKDDNFMITWSVGPPHAPWICPEPYYSMYDPAKMPLPKSWEKCPPEYKTSRATQMGRQMGEKLVREQMRCYYGQVTMVDSYVGRILKALSDEGLEKNTIVVYLSDHGDMQAAHGMAGKSVNSFFEEIVRVPMIIRYPGEIKAGTVVNGHANSVDIMPTLLEYGGMQAPKGIHGKSLKPLIEGKVKDSERLGYCERGNKDYSRMVRTEQWKYSIYSDGRRELFDLKNDPGEMTNLAADASRASTVADLHAKLRRHMAETADPVLASVPKT